MGIENVRAFEGERADPGPAIMEVNDPHKVLEIIRELDDSIDRNQRDKAKYLARYQELMKGYEEHYHMVMNRPEPEPGYPDERPSYGR